MRSEKPEVARRARSLRRTQTDAEIRLWHYLRDRRLQGHKFRRQFPIGPYFADFACEDKRVIVELDGGQHVEQAGYDETRTAFLTAQGYRVMRFWNDQIFNETDRVLEEILRVLSEF